MVTCHWNNGDETLQPELHFKKKRRLSKFWLGLGFVPYCSGIYMWCWGKNVKPIGKHGHHSTSSYKCLLPIKKS